MKRQKHYITLRAGIFSASLEPMEEPPMRIDIVKPLPILNTADIPVVDEAGAFQDTVMKKWTFELLRIDPPLEGFTSAPIAEYRLVKES